jgi:hypothetical protein
MAYLNDKSPNYNVKHRMGPRNNVARSAASIGTKDPDGVRLTALTTPYLREPTVPVRWVP